MDFTYWLAFAEGVILALVVSLPAVAIVRSLRSHHAWYLLLAIAVVVVAISKIGAR